LTNALALAPGPRITVEPGTKMVTVTLCDGKNADQIVALKARSRAWDYTMAPTQVVCIYVL